LECVQVDLVAEAGRERLDGAGGVVAAAATARLPAPPASSEATGRMSK
jgi:hypothetical protein